MYAKIESNKIKELCALDHDGEDGWEKILDADVGKVLTYDTDTSAVRAKTDEENATEFDARTLEAAWWNLRSQRNMFLRDTDEFMVSDRAATTNMPEYREHLRDLPAEYNNVSILSQTDVMDFDAYVESL